MEPGELRRVDTGNCRDLYLLETGMYDVTGYGAVYIVDDDRPAVIETGIGTNYDAILEGLAKLDIEPEQVEVIAVTHVHLDHAGGAGFLADACENATVLVHEVGAPHLVDPERLIAGTKQAVGDQWQYYTEPAAVPEERIREIVEGDRIDLGTHTLTALSAPGHAPHQVVFHVPTMDAVFTGDAAGIWVPEWETVVETSPPPNFDLEQALADLETIRACEPQTLLYTHFGPAGRASSRLESFGEVLTAWVEEVASVREELADEDAVMEYFAERTERAAVWSDHKARAEARVNVKGVLHYLDRQ